MALELCKPGKNVYLSARLAGLPEQADDQH